MACLATPQTITLAQAVSMATTNDPWLVGNKLRQSAITAESIAAASLPDPKVSLGVLNLPADNLGFHQEAMTQIKLGISQMFPRGESLAIKQKILQLKSSKHPLMRDDRKAQVTATVTMLWLDAFLAQQSIALINQDKALFEQMVDLAKASYSSTVGKTRQQDVIRAQLELIQLNDTLTVQQQKLDMAIASLNQWLYPQQSKLSESDFIDQLGGLRFKIAEQLPDITLLDINLNQQHQLIARLAQHPLVLALDIQQKMAQSSVTLANERFKPQWGVNASYAYRDHADNGGNRADLFSVGVTFDVPLFTNNRQDKQLAASVARSEAVKTEKLLLIKQMLSQVTKFHQQLKYLSKRQQLYQQELLLQSHEQAEASLTAYTHDDGDFAEVVRAKIAELNHQIAALDIDVELLKAVAQLNYYLTPSPKIGIIGE